MRLGFYVLTTDKAVPLSVTRNVTALARILTNQAYSNLVNIAATIAGMLLFFWRVSIKLAKLEMKLNMIWKWYKREHDIEGDD